MKPRLRGLNFNRRGLERILGELEASVMEQMWRSGDASVRDIHEALAPRKLAYTTIMTVMGRLAEKGFLSKVPASHTFRYRPLVSKTDLENAMLIEVTDSLRDMALPALIHFVDRLPSDHSALEELEKLLSSKRALLKDKGNEGEGQA